MREEENAQIQLYQQVGKLTGKLDTYIEHTSKVFEMLAKNDERALELLEEHRKSDDAKHTKLDDERESGDKELHKRVNKVWKFLLFGGGTGGIVGAWKVLVQ